MDLTTKIVHMTFNGELSFLPYYTCLRCRVFGQRDGRRPGSSVSLSESDFATGSSIGRMYKFDKF